ncbi:efflux RND transporter periplasmic adaptor subunit [Cupriavidus gilardii]|uniref:efflux RND transporter periplasmic adaptor subunit n=1 Tax=Cupriavidus gilardii TaxID=82541 RepID=UPI0011EE7DE5|nr:efflux RND transporter periplasmic adaptor subunit [Cupriavidus gilardii]KAA0178773.1 efflux RND transporter periplasmic adaptor subunit [Cupriavidus gilardii]MCT9119136.1 efflux RND transporter periplasmic adaptor subunit [Cupriavidus gilardii]MCT9124970.1 efflux RND transporter periplasmic adaptor subunit [Cupriavidus gilardii]UXC34543.1 efflux RND transporter periplasmic adaptor subunit [Cupriavidus gilardii]
MTRATLARAVATLVVTASLVGAYFLGHRQGRHGAPSAPAAPADEPSQKAGDIDPKSGKRILYWHDPMVPGQRFDKPGKSPFMDMPLAPVYEEAGGSAAVTIDSRVAQNLGIRTAEVKTGRLESTLQVPGNVAINERGIEVIQARATGFIERTYARTTLDTVRKGQALAQIYAPEWIAAQEEYLAVSRMTGTLSNDLREAAIARMRQAGMSEGHIRLVQSTGKLQPRLTVTSSLGGIVTEVGVRDGMTVSPGTTLFRIASLATVWVLAEVPESQAASLRPGQMVSATAAALPGQTLAGKVDAILPDISMGTRTVKVRIELPNKARQLLPGMFVSVRFDAPAGPERLLIPVEALIRTGTHTFVMVQLDSGEFQPVEVTAGAAAGGQAEILAGLQAGQKVVVSGQFLLDSEASLRGTAQRMAAPAADASAAVATQAPSPEHQGVGRVEAISADGMTISHGPIPSANWGPMTMEFAAPSTGMLTGFKPGDRVRFRFRLNDEGVATLSSVEAATADTGARR